MNIPRFEAIAIGHELAVIRKQALTRKSLALFAGASGDHNGVHIDIDIARAAGLPDVIGHGMLTMAYLAQVLTAWAPPSAIRCYSVRFMAPTRIGDVLTCTGKVVAKCENGPGKAVRVELQAVDQFGEVKAQGDAEVAC